MSQKNSYKTAMESKMDKIKSSQMAEARVREAAELIKNFLKDRNITLDRIIIFGSYAKALPLL